MTSHLAPLAADLKRDGYDGVISLESVYRPDGGDFEADFRALADALAATGADLAFANLPGVTAIPFVNTIAPVLVDPSTLQPVLIGGFPVPLIGPDGPLSLGDKVLLPAGALLARGAGIPLAFGGNGRPLPDTVVLSVAELAAIQDRTDAINDVIATVAAEKGAALVDMERTFNRLLDRGLNVGGAVFTVELFGGLFSFDGVHASPFGYAVVANEFIRTINRKFSGSIPLVSFVPFVSGAGGNIGAVPGLDTSRTILTSRAQRNLRKILGHRSPKRLLRLKKRWEQQQEAEQQGG